MDCLKQLVNTDILLKLAPASSSTSSPPPSRILDGRERFFWDMKDLPTLQDWPVRCPECKISTSLKSIGVANTHIFALNFPNPMESIECKTCDRQFISHQQLTRHLLQECVWILPQCPMNYIFGPQTLSESHQPCTGSLVLAREQSVLESVKSHVEFKCMEHVECSSCKSSLPVHRMMDDEHYNWHLEMNDMRQSVIDWLSESWDTIIARPYHLAAIRILFTNHVKKFPSILTSSSRAKRARIDSHLRV